MLSAHVLSEFQVLTGSFGAATAKDVDYLEVLHAERSRMANDLLNRGELGTKTERMESLANGMFDVFYTILGFEAAGIDRRCLMTLPLKHDLWRVVIAAGKMDALLRRSMADFTVKLPSACKSESFDGDKMKVAHYHDAGSTVVLVITPTLYQSGTTHSGYAGEADVLYKSQVVVGRGEREGEPDVDMLSRSVRRSRMTIDDHRQLAEEDTPEPRSPSEKDALARAIEIGELDEQQSSEDSGGDTLA